MITEKVITEDRVKKTKRIQSKVLSNTTIVIATLEERRGTVGSDS